MDIAPVLGSKVHWNIIILIFINAIWNYMVCWYVFDLFIAFALSHRYIYGWNWRKKCVFLPPLWILTAIMEFYITIFCKSVIYFILPSQRALIDFLDVDISKVVLFYNDHYLNIRFWSKLNTHCKDGNSNYATLLRG